MQIKATSIFLYDLYLLGYCQIDLTELFCQTLYEYIASHVVEFPEAIVTLFDAYFDGKQIQITISAAIFAAAYRLAQMASVNNCYASRLFDDIPFELADQIGRFTVGFSSYLTDKIEEFSNDALTGASINIKQ